MDDPSSAQMPARRRELFVGDRESERRAARLRGVLAAQVVLVIAALVVEAQSLSRVISIAAGLSAIAAVLAATHVAAQIRRDQRRIREEAYGAIDAAGVMFITVDRDCRIQLANTEACAVLGRSEADLLGRPFQDIIADEAERERSRAAFEEVVAERIVPAEYRSLRTIARPDGERRVCAWRFGIRRDDTGRIVGLLVCGEDVTEEQERVRAQAREQADLEHLRKLAKALATQDDARPTVIDEIRELSGADFVALFEPSGDRTGEWVHTTSTTPEITGRPIPADSPSAALAAARAQQPTFIPDALGDPRANQDMVRATRVRSLWFEPVLDADRAVAVLVLGWHHPIGRPDARWAQLIALAADETAIALRRVATLEHLRTAALTDSLTGVANRRAFDLELRRAVARADRDGQPLTLIYLDLNGFKALNDAEGHGAGDMTLIACAAAWGEELRAGDLLARLGGDEFAAILPGCPEGAGRDLAARLRRATPHPAGAGAGAATRQAGEDTETLQRRADRALYADKPADGLALPAGPRA